MTISVENTGLQFYKIEHKNIFCTNNLLSLSRPLTPSGHFCQTFSPAFVLGQHKYESKTIGQNMSVESGGKKGKWNTKWSYILTCIRSLQNLSDVRIMLTMPSNKKCVIDKFFLLIF